MTEWIVVRSPLDFRSKDCRFDQATIARFSAQYFTVRVRGVFRDRSIWNLLV